MHNQFKAQSTSIIIVILALIIAVGGGYIFLQSRSQKVAVETTTTIPTTTTQEPITTTITATPTTKSVFVAPSNWIVYKDTKNGFEFTYPKHFFFSDPVVAVYDCSNLSVFPSRCSEFNLKYYYPEVSNDESSTGTRIVINNMQFCVNSVKEGAMGSTYDTVFYMTLKNKKCIVIKTVIQIYNNCVDVDNPTKCEAHNQNNYTVLNQVISTLHFFNPNGN
ncbi:MAG: hypothetical protein COW25_00150 [Candidatus Nealsonbacteria bacterium CG15_BIG_FIL_POST_REV_8_21_14_020_37_12]|uniref:Uncharacterized protein n=1 Tax=Candidatus Nealsonbacteria bacterium CG15_BIG_FIL_POST_REV_8_21_14_020_37_12 TaxID=1974716 RepID=A0A2M7H1Y5_9BACT|nr:MAG: hypothetical protein COW25_00150 [Candidatus Nealsonbacteria bacterium CG15_BIG_FIL_POST_REV_8_21_14_020_37_12]